MMRTYAEADLRAAVAAAIRAPSLHNSQPWRFRLRDGAIEVRIDRSRALPSTGSGIAADWAVNIACGAATFNMRLALAVCGVPAAVRLRPYPQEPDVIASLAPDAPRRAAPAEQILFAVIPRRHSNRLPFWPDPVSAHSRWRLTEAARAEGAWLEPVTGTAAVEALGRLAHNANRTLSHDPEYQADVARWTRLEPAPDGVPAFAGGPIAEPQDLLPQRPFGELPRAPGRDFEPEPLLGVLGTAGDTGYDQITAGQALQRVLLTAAEAGLAVSMLSQPIEVPSAREQLRQAVRRASSPQMVLRIGYGQPGWPTPRRDVDDVIDA